MSYILLEHFVNQVFMFLFQMIIENYWHPGPDAWDLNVPVFPMPFKGIECLQCFLIHHTWTAPLRSFGSANSPSTDKTNCKQREDHSDSLETNWVTLYGLVIKNVTQGSDHFFDTLHQVVSATFFIMWLMEEGGSKISKFV